MSSSRQPPRPRYRFGFKGKRPSRTPKATKTNEIPDSLTRYAKLMEEDGKDRILGLQAVLGVESDEMHFQPSNLEATRMFKPFKTKNLGVFAFGAMFIGGLTFLWIYSRLSESLNLQTLTTLQQTISRIGFTDWQKIILVAVSALTAALLARRSRRRVQSGLLPGV